MSDEISNAFKRNSTLGNDFTEIDEDRTEAFILTKSIYHPRLTDKNGKPRYYLSNEEIHFISKRALAKYGLDTIRKFYEKMKEDDLLGKRDEFDLDAMTNDIDIFLGKKPKEKPVKKTEIAKISDAEQSNRYMHLIYAPNKVNVDVLKEEPIEAITVLTNSMAVKFGHKAIEILIDYCTINNLIPKKGAWSYLSVQEDIKMAIKWSIENSHEYPRA